MELTSSNACPPRRVIGRYRIDCAYFTVTGAVLDTGRLDGPVHVCPFSFRKPGLFLLSLS